MQYSIITHSKTVAEFTIGILVVKKKIDSLLFRVVLFKCVNVLINYKTTNL